MVALTVAVLGAAAWLVVALRIAGQRRRAPPLPPPAADPPDIIALLPVRNEEENVLPCLATLLAAVGKPRVRVIDDSSSDRTAELVAGLASAEPRLELVSAGPLPEGWNGKVHANEVGARGLDTPWLLLTDADTRHDPTVLARAAAAAHGLAAVSLTGTQEAVGWGEQLLTPAVFALLDGLLGDWQAAAAGTGPPVANGQFILLDRAAWERCGGFTTIRGAVCDDLALARRLGKHGLRVGFFRAPGLLRIRMYRGLGATASGWRRNLAAVLGARPILMVALLAGLLATPAALLVLLLQGDILAAALLWSAGVAASALLRAGSEHRAAMGVFFPLDAALLATLLALAWLDLRRGSLAAWKGRPIRVGNEDNEDGQPTLSS